MRADPGGCVDGCLSDGPRPDIRVVIDSTPMAVREALCRLHCALAPLGLTDDEATTMELVLAEALNNVVEHAYATRAGRIEVHCVPAHGGLICEVTDEGIAMPQGAPPVGMAPEPRSPVHLHPEGGFGWFLIRTLTQDLEYARIDGRNRLSFRMPVAACATAD